MSKNTSFSKNKTKKKDFGEIKTNLIINSIMGMKLVLMFFATVVALAVFVIIVLALFEWMVPDAVHFLNYKMTASTFEELKSNGHYHQAINLLESNAAILKTEDMVQFRTEQADCYLHIGDYSKAERLYLVNYHDPFEGNEEMQNKIESLPREARNGIMVSRKFTAARDLFKLYEVTGNLIQQKKYYEIMSSLKNDYLKYMLVNCQEEFDSINVRQTFERLYGFDDIRMKYVDEPVVAIGELEQFVNDLIEEDSESVYGVLEISMLNKLVSWKLEQERLSDAYQNILDAINIANSLNYRILGDYSGLGELSDYCYLTHDIQNGERFLKCYLDYLDETYEKDDLGYIKNSTRRIRLLERDKDWKKIEDYLETSCRGAQQLIERNFQSMSEEEREHFAKELDSTYHYATELLLKHPSDNLANICFDNLVFKKGLLLQSNLAVKNAVDAMNDSVLIKQYSNYISKRQELAARNSLTGLGNALAKRRLEKEINQLDKEISSRCWLFQYNNTSASITRRDIQKALNDDEVFVELSESQSGELFALILCNTGHVKYVPISKTDSIKPYLCKQINSIYSDTSFANTIWGGIAPFVEGRRKVYYSTDGLFNQISIPALFYGGVYLCDNYSFKLVSNAKRVVELKEQKNVVLASISLWGGINYDYENVNSICGEESRDTIHRAAIRGNHLYQLPGSYLEVDAIAKMMHNPNLLMGDEATESSFKERSGKRDNILHISTHGFFKEAGAYESKISPMENSGLFFAGANKYWKNDVIRDSFMGEDGILRSVEIAEQDLTDCQLAVLSACETGLGFSDSEEGVFGLQRAFKLAGVNKIMMSLWKVNDWKTKEFMVRFYQHLIVNGQTIDDAFELTQKEMRDNGEYPNCWAAFVLLD